MSSQGATSPSSDVNHPISSPELIPLTEPTEPTPSEQHHTHTSSTSRRRKIKHKHTSSASDTDEQTGHHSGHMPPLMLLMNDLELTTQLNRKLKQENATLKKEKEALNRELNATQRKLDRIEKDRAHLVQKHSEQISELRSNYDQVKKDLEYYRDLSNKNGELLGKLQAENDMLRKENKEIRIENQTLKNEIQIQRSEIRVLRDEVKELQLVNDKQRTEAELLRTKLLFGEAAFRFEEWLRRTILVGRHTFDPIHKDLNLSNLVYMDYRLENGTAGNNDLSTRLSAAEIVNWNNVKASINLDITAVVYPCVFILKHFRNELAHCGEDHLKVTSDMLKDRASDLTLSASGVSTNVENVRQFIDMFSRVRGDGNHILSPLW